MNQLQTSPNRDESNIEVITRYLVSEEGAVELSAKQQELLARLNYADELIRRNEYTREGIATLIKRKFGISRATAYQVIVQAENIFASSTPLNKQYRIQLRIEFLERKISELWAGVAFPEAPQYDDVDQLLAGAMLHESNREYVNEALLAEKMLQGYYKLYPEITPKRPVRKIVFQLLQDKIPVTNLSIQEAMKADGFEDIDHENVD